MAGLFQGLQAGQSFGGNIQDHLRQRRMDQLARELQQFKMQQEAKHTAIEDRTAGREDKRLQLAQEMQAFNRDRTTQADITNTADNQAQESTTPQEIETALAQITGKDPTDRSPEDAALENALRRRMGGALQQSQNQVNQQGEAQAAQYGTPEQIDAAMAQRATVSPYDKSPEDAAIEAALMRRRATMQVADQKQSAARETLDMDPVSGDVISRRVVRPYSGAPGADAAPAAAGQQTAAPQATAGNNAGGPNLTPGAIVVQNGRRFRFRGGDSRDPANYEAQQ